MYDSILTSIASLQSILIILESFYVLQGILHECSKTLRLAFIILPIGASLELLDMAYGTGADVKLIILNLGILFMLYWLWNQKNLFQDLELILKSKKNTKPYDIVGEVEAILSCFAIWILRKVHNDFESRCVVCERILPK